MQEKISVAYGTFWRCSEKKFNLPHKLVQHSISLSHNSFFIRLTEYNIYTVQFYQYFLQNKNSSDHVASNQDADALQTLLW